MKISYILTITDDMIGVDLLNNIMSQKTETLYKYYISADIQNGPLHACGDGHPQ